MARSRGCSACEDLSKNLGGGIFLSLEDDGDDVEVAFVGFIQGGEDAEPEGQETVWIDGGSEEYDPDNRKHKGLQPQAKFFWNVYVRDAKEVKIWKQGSKFFRTWLKDKNRKGMEYWFIIERDGKAGSKRTEYRLHREDVLTSDELKDLKGLKLLSFERTNDDDDDDDDDSDDRGSRRSGRRRSNRSSKSSSRDERGSKAADDDKDDKSDKDDKKEAKSKSKSNGETVDRKTLERIREKLKSGADPKAALARFIEKFDIEKVKDLPSDWVDDAMAFIAADAGDSSNTDTDEIDPFE